MSSVSVQACPTVGCTFVPHGEMLGISGTTGNSTGPHLHLLVRNPAGRSVDPYGWRGSGAIRGSQPAGVTLGDLSCAQYYGSKIYPSGPALAIRPLHPPASWWMMADPGFSRRLDCWNDIAVPGSQGGVMRYSRARTTSPPAPAMEPCLQARTMDFYSLYVRSHPSSHHRGRGLYHPSLRQVRHRCRQPGCLSQHYYVADGWLYIGKYNFDGNGGEYIEVTNRTQDETAISNLFVGVDAVRFVFQGDVTPTPMTPVTVTSTHTPSYHSHSNDHPDADPPPRLTHTVQYTPHPRTPQPLTRTPDTDCDAHADDHPHTHRTRTPPSRVPPPEHPRGPRPAHRRSHARPRHAYQGPNRYASV
jgi:hypothetical protein